MVTLLCREFTNSASPQARNPGKEAGIACLLPEIAGGEFQKIALAPISLAETVYLVEKRRLPATAFEDLRAALRNPKNLLEEAPFTGDVVACMRLVPRDAVPDMPDRIVAATAIYLGVPVISKDGRIRASTVNCIW